MVISLFYKGTSKEIPYFKHQKRIFWISSNFSQSVLAGYCGYDLKNSGACKVDMGGTSAPILVSIFQILSSGDRFGHFFFPEPRSWNKCVHFFIFCLNILKSSWFFLLSLDSFLPQYTPTSFINVFEKSIQSFRKCLTWTFMKGRKRGIVIHLV